MSWPKDFILYRCPHGHVSHTAIPAGARLFFGADTKLCTQCMKVQARKAPSHSEPVIMTRMLGDHYYTAFRLGGIEAVEELVREEMKDG